MKYEAEYRLLSTAHKTINQTTLRNAYIVTQNRDDIMVIASNSVRHTAISRMPTQYTITPHPRILLLTQNLIPIHNLL